MEPLTSSDNLKSFKTSHQNNDTDMAQIRPLVPRIQEFEDAIQETGWGLYYKFVVGFTAFNLFTNGLALLTIYFAVPLSACDISLYVGEVTAIHICFLIGKAIGGFILCSISDNVGKKCMIPKSSMFIFISSFVSAFAHNAYLLYMSAFFLGSGVQANVLTTKIYLAEILPKHKRGFYMVLPDLLWTLGYFSITGISYFMTGTTTVEHQGMDMRLTSWRIIFALAGGFSITMACCSALLEMSPRYLLFKKRIVTATLVLKQFYAINRSKYSETFDLHGNQLQHLISDYQISNEFEPNLSIRQIRSMLKVMLQIMRVLLQRRFVTIFVAIIFIKVPGLFGLVGINIFLSRNLLFPNKNFVEGYDFLNITDVKLGKHCSIVFDFNLYKTFLLLSINILAGQALLLCSIDVIGRKIPICLGLALCGIASFVLAFTRNFIIKVIFSSTFTIFYTTVDSALNVIVIESFPTAVRGTAGAQSCFYSLILACFIYRFLYMPIQNFLIILGSIFLGVAVVAICCIRETRRRPMVE